MRVNFRLLATLVAMALAPMSGAWGAAGDSWSLSGDMQAASNPGPPIDPGAPGGGTGTWSYYRDNLTTLFSVPVSGDITASVNPELPNAGIGWVHSGANHIALVRFDVAANPVPPSGTGDDKTNFGIGEIGGHATIGASWTTDHAGAFLVEWLGYNARNQATANPNEKGRSTTLRVIAGGSELDARAITGGINDGLAGAYSNSAVVNLLAGQTISIAHEGGEWSGLDLKIREVPEPHALALGIAGLLLAARKRR